MSGRSSPDALLTERRTILDADGISKALRALADEIAKRNKGVDLLVLVGVRTGGVYLAERLQALLRKKGREVLLGSVDITLYRDDVFRGLPRPEVGPTDLPFPIEDRVIVLVDDVLYTGRTVRAAIDVLVEFGRPKVVQLAVLVDRGHRELPIQADYVAARVKTTHRQSIRVALREQGDPEDRVILREKSE